MAKLPAAGRVKTRLAREAGVVRATWFYRHALAAVVQRVAPGPWRTELAITPDSACHARGWPAHIVREPQGAGDLGRRIQRIADRSGAGPVVIIGSDVPGIGRAHVAAAFRALADHDAVLGPAADGGYWLVGLAGCAKRRWRPFAGVRWSSPHAFADTLRNLAGARVAVLTELRDVDGRADLETAGATCGRRVLPGSGHEQGTDSSPISV